MAGSRRLFAAPAPEARSVTPRARDSGFAGALLATAGGRAILVGTAVKLIVLLLLRLSGPSSSLNIIDTLASLAVAAGGAYFLIRALAAARRRLLWRVRRKLIISYIFIGFIPALLIVAFFLLGGFMLFSNFSSYLVQTRLRELSERALAIADATALEIRLADGRDVKTILERRQRALARETPTASLAVVPVSAPCSDVDGRRSARRTQVLQPETAGPWSHVEPPTEVPAWIGCDGFAGLVAYRSPPPSAGQSSSTSDDVDVLVRAVALPQSVAQGLAVFVDMPVDHAVKDRLRADTSVELTGAQLKSDAAHVLEGRPTSGEARAAQPAVTRLPQPAVSFLEYRDWATGAAGTLQASMQLSVGEIYTRISDARGSVDGRSLGEAWVILLLLVGGLFLLIQVIAVVMGLALARSITGSVHELFTGTVKVQHGDFTHRIAVTARDQLGALAESFNSMTGSIENLLLEAAEKKRLEEELRIAHEIQMSLLPQAPASIQGLSITALCVPAREVGGDYYDFLPLDDHRLGLLIADVAGKGTSAALYMAELKGLVLSLSRMYRSPRELLIMANRLIAEHLAARSFITMTYAVLDLQAKTMTYARAGHTPLLYLPGVCGDDARRIQVLAPDGLVLGLKIDDGQLFERLLEEQTLPLRPGDVYMFFTDGITEAMNAHDDCFGEQRLGQLIEDHAHLPCDELRERMLRDVAAFVGDAPQHDDMTMILLKVDELPGHDRGTDGSADADMTLTSVTHS
jgi:phosphoserine phosphatase RsbU/P